MPGPNRFRHQAYLAETDPSSFELLSPPLPPPMASEVGRCRLRTIGEAFRRVGVRAIYLLHGTFVGTDALGLIRGIARQWPELAEGLYRRQKRAWDTLAGDAGNFSTQYATELEQAINREGDDGSRIPVRLFYWSSENHHVGRADAAIRLIDELVSRSELHGGRVLLCGHSHGGNVLALVTNLVANDRATNRDFFEATRLYYRSFWGRKHADVWERVRSLWDVESGLPINVSLDLVTLGTPVRYGWDLGGAAHLLHFINHRPDSRRPSHLAAFPPAIGDLLAAVEGDYVQQLGIAGTDAPPPLWAWRAWRAERRLARLLQPGMLVRHTLARLKLGVRLHDAGMNLLVDYGLPEGHVGQHLAGHAVYTRLAWLPFHFEQIARRFYQCDDRQSND